MSLDRIALGPIQNPVRTLLHGGAALLSVAGTVVLWRHASGDSARLLSLLIFGLSMVALFTVSSLYHSSAWRGDPGKRMQRLDHSMIYVLIAGTYTPFAAAALDGWPRAVVLAATWTIALVGILQKIIYPRVRKRWSVTLQLVQGWLILPLVFPLARQLPPGAVLLLVTGGLAYTAGAACYVSQRPRLWPRVFSYHELFHACVVLAAALHYTAALRYLALGSAG